MAIIGSTKPPSIRKTLLTPAHSTSPEGLESPFANLATRRNPPPMIRRRALCGVICRYFNFFDGRPGRVGPLESFVRR